MGGYRPRTGSFRMGWVHKEKTTRPAWWSTLLEYRVSDTLLWIRHELGGGVGGRAIRGGHYPAARE